MNAWFVRFLKVMQDQLALNEDGDNFVCFEEMRFKKLGFSISDIEQFKDILIREKQVVRFIEWKGDPQYPLPSKPSDKEKTFGLLWFLRGAFREEGKAIRKYTFEIASKQGFIQFCRQAMGKPVMAVATSRNPVPSFDVAKSKILLGIKTCEIPINTNQHYFCAKMFSVPFGAKVASIDFSEADGWTSEGRKAVYDTLRDVNEKIKADFGLENFFLWKREHAWINEKLFES